MYLWVLLFNLFFMVFGMWVKVSLLKILGCETVGLELYYDLCGVMLFKFFEGDLLIKYTVYVIISVQSFYGSCFFLSMYFVIFMMVYFFFYKFYSAVVYIVRSVYVLF